MSNFTLFQSDSNSSTSGNAFDQDAFSDISLVPTNNTGLTDTASTNPLGLSFANDDSVRLGVKTLYIKDIVLLSDHSKWVSGKPTYSIIWNESCPYAQGYVFGNIQIAQQGIQFNNAQDGFGLTGVFRKVAFIVSGDRATTATGQIAIDGANTSTATYQNLAAMFHDDSNGDNLTDTKYNVYVSGAANQVYGLHDFRLTANEIATLRIIGVIIYSENSGQNVDVFPGTTYNNKTKVTTSLGATLALPSYACQLGGRALYYKTANAGYTNAVLGAANIQSVATGSTGTNLLNVTTGTGASFPLGSGIAAFWGTTGFVGSVTNQSTDTLTVSPTLSFGISGLIYKTWSAGQSLAIQSSLMILSSSFDLNKVGVQGFSSHFTQTHGKYRIWGKGFGFTALNTGATNVSGWPALVSTNVSLGFIRVEGLFTAADVEFVGQGILHATVSINGYPGWNINGGQTGSVKKTIFTDGGMQWNGFNINWGSSHSGIGINRINLYERALPAGISYALLSQMDTLPAYINQAAVNATYISQGTYQRHFADSLPLTGYWLRSVNPTSPGGIQWGATAGSGLSFQYYGKNFSVLGVNGGQSLALALDGGAAAGFNFNVMQSVATEMFHTIALTNPGGGTAVIGAIDVCRTQGEIKSLQTFVPVVQTQPAPFSEVHVYTANGYGAALSVVRSWKNIGHVIGTAISYVDDTLDGARFIINEDGLYAVSWSDQFNAAQDMSISKNDIGAADNVLPKNCLAAGSTGGNAFAMCLSVTVYLSRGDCIRCVTGGTPSGADTFAENFRITKVK